MQFSDACSLDMDRGKQEPEGKPHLDVCSRDGWSGTEMTQENKGPLYRDGAPAATPSTLPEPGSVSAVNEWTLVGLPDGSYTWTLWAVDSAYNGGLPAEGTFVVGDTGAVFLFSDGFESGDLSGWSLVSP